MTDLIATSKLIAVVGTGVSGLSAARFLQRNHQRFALFDTRAEPPNRQLIAEQFADVHCEFGHWDAELLASADEIIVSPGIATTIDALAPARDAGVPIVGDIEVFVRHARAPIVAITGSNGKSTVTTLVGEMAKAAGLEVAVGGNLGTPALDLLDDAVELYVLELSSFQLETVSKLGAQVACILNISPDHMDRYSGMPAYHAAKQRVYFGARNVVVNRQDPLTRPPLADDVALSSFGGAADFKNIGTIEQQGELYLSADLKPLIPVSELKIKGQHNIANAQAALAIGRAAGLPMADMLAALREFTGLAHRCEWVGQVQGVDYINDSKGTNVGATLAAINGMAPATGKLVVLLGGVAKDRDFSSLIPALNANAKAVILYGQDADVIATSLGDKVDTIVRAQGLQDAVGAAARVATAGDAVLLSPACASFDEFNNYSERGDAFRRYAQEAAHA
ncbi:UDP-N-acetylmuramoyl-L-alanine--D-glutamate ligase [Gilvimarinus sp. DA14]|uniref:UDP-N-acetylmuramoyl-L-alanine--D-glutamate ligase n=1 Tax=Gilvimarinus sp. DA14 TaxID=2956798 RepID=UPI0020B78A72|nr:UDP-N-acetylmuramoyl-L-alanine--D-glutamate ligase [Gilvimarinus sp. DA14]UTF59643.1 UDP-N-acetylmuramoyl-L-alanine--D-glutamate ligase [Gilvimarinus sp. DA14]